ncbi:PAS domain S-box protein [Variovorax sp. GT1P44]|uniref:hybrid sensor histidine kinase/response regulator n=1 Tax=Variovorax sp. GT1P44 TaxID=3443742 RepID=UPI003F45ACC0
MDPLSKFATTLGAEERYRLLVDAVEEYAIYMLDPDGFVVSWNSGAQRLKGYTEPEILGRHFSTFYTPEDISAGAPTLTLTTTAREGRYETEGWRVCKDGRRFWAQVLVHPIRSSEGELIGYAKVTRDLSDRRSAEEALRRSEEQFRMLVQAVTDYAIYMLDPEGVITSWNAGAERAKGYAPDEAIGTHFSRFYRQEDRERGEPARALATAAAEGRFESEGWRVRKDGTEFWANAVVDPIFNGEGKLVGFAKITRDITEKRRAQFELEKARDALFQAQKLDAIGQLTGGVAHDFNNLLMVVLSSLELLRRRLPAADEKLQGLVNNAIQGARRGAALTQRMLSFARRQDLAPVAVDVPKLIAGMREMLRRTLGSTIQVATVFPAAPARVLVDPNQLELAILNLAVNARDAMPDGGQLELKVEEKTVTDGPGLRPGNYVGLLISDTGSGMDAATLERAVEPFFTTKGVGKGTGLGLPMVQGLAAQSGGQFVLTSAEGVGTTAALWLPVALGEAAAIEREPAAETSSLHPGQSLRVVVVDDDSLVLSNTASMLEDLGHTVMTASSGQEALDMVLGEPSVGLVLSDHLMPGMTGTQLFEVIRKQRPELPLILATGYAELPQGLSVFTSKLAKPFNQDELATAIERAVRVREWRASGLKG